MRKLLVANIILLVAYTNIKVPIKQEEIKPIIQETKQDIQLNANNATNSLPKNVELKADTDLRIKSNLTASDYNKMLLNTNLKGLGQSFKEAEDKHNVNGLYLMGLACLESGYGKSNFAIKRNNLFGWNAKDSNPNGASYFDSKGDCILHVASKLQKNYLTEGAVHFNGYSGRAVDKKYCSDPKHIDKIIKIVDRMKREVV